MTRSGSFNQWGLYACGSMYLQWVAGLMLLITRAMTSGIFECSVPLARLSQQMSRDVRLGDNKQGVLARGFSLR